MELEELKNSWAALDKRLKENNSLNETIILRMVQGKAEKSINRLLGYEIVGTIIVLLIIPLIAYSMERFQDEMLLFWNLLMITSGILCSFSAILGIYKISILSKIDFTKKVSVTIYHFNKYRILLKREFFAVNYVLTPILFIMALLTYAEVKASFSLWTFLGCMNLLLVLILWYTNKKYKKIHAAIAANLDEIKELKEE